MAEAHLWHHGSVYTGHRYREALLVHGERVVGVGSLSEMRRLAPTGTLEHDLAGGLLVPGLVDAHLHLADLALAEQALDLSSARSVREIVERVRAHPRPAGGTPLVGQGWNLPGTAGDGWPTRAELDGAGVDVPVILFHASGHAAVVNSAALRALGVRRETPEPKGGRIGRGTDGEPNGQLFETALNGVSRLASTVLEKDPSRLYGSLSRLAALGITSVGTMNIYSPEFEALRSLAASGRLPIQVRAYLSVPWFTELGVRKARTLPTSGPLRVAGVKGFADGAFGTRTAWISQPYRDDPTNVGMPVQGTEELIAVFRQARELGLTPAVHALGDRGVDRALDVLEKSRVRGTHTAERLEHAGLLPPALLSKIRRVRPVAVIQPSFVASDHWLEARLGSELSRFAYLFRTLMGAGCALSGSSDAPMDALDPWAGIRAAIDRCAPDGRSANLAPKEALTLPEAVEAYTLGGARALHEPGVGELVEGSRADLVWLDAPDLVRALPRGAAGVRETWVGGNRVYSAPTD